MPSDHIEEPIPSEAVAAIPCKSPPASERHFAMALCLLAGCVFLGQLRSLGLVHAEGDEVVFTFLAERLAAEPWQYHVRGEIHDESATQFIGDTWMRLAEFDPDPAWVSQTKRRLAALDHVGLLHPPLDASTDYAYNPDIYDRPMFFHPPVYPYLLALARKLFGSTGGVLLSALMQALGVALLGMLGRRWAGPGVGLIAAAILAIDPVAWLCGSRLWIDGTLVTAVILAVLVWDYALKQRGRWMFFIAGICFALAALTKFTAVFIVPTLVLMALLEPRRPRPKQLGAFAAAAAPPIAAWLILSRFVYGQWLPDVGSTAWLIERNPFIRSIVNRPAHFYLTGLLMVAPVHLMAVIAFGRGGNPRWLWMALAWLGAFFAGLTALGMTRIGLNLRFLAPGLPGLCLLAAAGGAKLGRWGWVIGLPLALATLTAAWLGAGAPFVPEPYPWALDWLMNVLGLDLREIFPRMWPPR